MKNLLATTAAVVAILLPCADSLAAQVPGDVPTATLVAEDFSPMQEQWQPASGSWAASGGTYAASQSMNLIP